MSTRAQRRANKRNAQQSTGPQTDAGKQRSSQNALQHGLLAKHPVIPGEDPVQYQHKLDQLRDDIRPVNALEDDLVEQIADASWRLKRIARIQAAVAQRRIEMAGGEKQNLGKEEFDALDPNETLRLIEKELDAMMPETGQPGRREAK